jgi:hypothetical protein
MSYRHSSYRKMSHAVRKANWATAMGPGPALVEPASATQALPLEQTEIQAQCCLTVTAAPAARPAGTTAGASDTS